MNDGYDFTLDDIEIQAQRDAAAIALEWDTLTEKDMAGEINGLNSRVTACALQMQKMLTENDYKKTNDMLKALMLKDLGAEGWLMSFYNANKEYFLETSNTGKRPDWVKQLRPDEQSTYDVVMKYFREVKQLLQVSTGMYMVMQILPLAEGFKLLRIKHNLDGTGLDESFYRKVDQEIKSVSDLLNKDLGELEAKAVKSKKFLEENISRLPKGELEKAYREERIKDFQEIVRSYPVAGSLYMQPGGYFKVSAETMAESMVIDKYTYQIANTNNLKDVMQKVLDEARVCKNQDIAGAEKNCVTQSSQYLIEAFKGLLDEIVSFAELSKSAYESFREGREDAPYIFMKKLSALGSVSSKYSFKPDTSNPWDSGTDYAYTYQEAAKSIELMGRAFVYDSGATFY